MSAADLDRSSNWLIRSMREEDRGLLAPHAVRVDQERGEKLIAAGQAIRHVVFPEGGIMSVVAPTARGTRTEVGIFGREGMSGIATLMGSDHMPMDVITQVPAGTALRVPVEDLRRAFAASASLRDLLLRFCYSFMVQVSYSAIANAHHTLESRLARWLLMCHDRMDSDEIAITHEFMALMISAQRTGVTIALHVLEGAGMIRAKRGRVTILDRRQLRALAAGAYGKPEEEYERLITVPADETSRLLIAEG